jgi:hypothetical protein
VALATGDLATAKRLTAEQLVWARQIDDPVEQYEAHQTLAGIAIRERDWPAATKALDGSRLLLSVISGGVYRMWQTHAEARMALARGDLPQAERLLRAFLDSKSKALTGDVRFDARVRLADVYARRGDVASTERELVTASEEIERWRAQLSDAELRSLAFQDVGDRECSRDGAAGSRRRVGARTGRSRQRLGALRRRSRSPSDGGRAS